MTGGHSSEPFPESGPRHHTSKTGHRLRDLVEHLRSDVTKVGNPRGEELVETSPDVLSGLGKALADVERRDEPA